MLFQPYGIDVSPVKLNNGSMKTTPANVQLLRVGIVAEMLSISRSEAYRLISNGVIPAVRIGSCLRVPVKAIEQLVEKGSSEVAS